MNIIDFVRHFDDILYLLFNLNISEENLLKCFSKILKIFQLKFNFSKIMHNCEKRRYVSKYWPYSTFSPCFHYTYV